MYSILSLGNTFKEDIKEKKQRNQEHRDELKEILDQEFTENHNLIREKARKDQDYDKAWVRSMKASYNYMRHIHRLLSK